MEYGTVRRRGVKLALVARMNKAYVLTIRNIVNIRKHIYKTHQKDGSDTRQQRVNEKNGRWKRRDFNSPAADCRKRADTQSNADPADTPADLNPTPGLHSLLAQPVPI
jgi:hypothetical protein